MLKNLLIFSSSVVERSAVNRLVVGSNPTWGVNKNYSEQLIIFQLLLSIKGFFAKKIVLFYYVYNFLLGNIPK